MIEQCVHPTTSLQLPNNPRRTPVRTAVHQDLIVPMSNQTQMPSFGGGCLKRKKLEMQLRALSVATEMIIDWHLSKVDHAVNGPDSRMTVSVLAHQVHLVMRGTWSQDHLQFKKRRTQKRPMTMLKTWVSRLDECDWERGLGACTVPGWQMRYVCPWIRITSGTSLMSCPRYFNLFNTAQG